MMPLKNLLNNLNAGVLIIDRDHRVEWLNSTAKQWLGHIVEIGKRRKCYRTMTYSEGFCAVCPTGKTIDYGVPSHYEFNLPDNVSSKVSIKKTKGMNPASFEVIGIPIKGSDKSGARVMELILDVTERSNEKIQSEELMCQIEKMAAVGQLAAGVAHELNTPLTTMSIISRELKDRIDTMASGKNSGHEIDEYFADIEGEIKRCKTIVGDLLDFSKKHVYECVDTDINSIVPKAVSMLQKGSYYRDVEIITQQDSSIPIIQTDPERLQQVIFNCLKNAVEAVIDKYASKENKHEDMGRVIISTKNEDGFIKISISDNGCGISTDNLKKVFDPFFTTKPTNQGTGLGLSVSYGIIRDLKGDIQIESVLGKGTEVFLFLPAGGLTG